MRGRGDGSCNTFFGIPFAAAPIGERRWRPPAPAAKWGTPALDCTADIKPKCVQPADVLFSSPGYLQRMLEIVFGITSRNMSEDCE